MTKTQPKSIQIRPEHITVDEQGKVIINHSELAESVKAMISKAVDKNAPSPQAGLLDWNCRCSGTNSNC